MKKLFISCPMKNRSEKDIRNTMDALHKLAEEAFNQKLEVIDSYIEDNPPKDSKQAIWYLGESLKKLSEADYFVGIDMNSSPINYNGCEIETDVAVRYQIPIYLVNAPMVLPDVIASSKSLTNTMQAAVKAATEIVPGVELKVEANSIMDAIAKGIANGASSSMMGGM